MSGLALDIPIADMHLKHHAAPERALHRAHFPGAVAGIHHPLRAVGMFQTDETLFRAGTGNTEPQHAGPEGKAFPQVLDQEFGHSHGPGRRWRNGDHLALCV